MLDEEGKVLREKGFLPDTEELAERGEAALEFATHHAESVPQNAPSELPVPAVPRVEQMPQHVSAPGPQHDQLFRDVEEILEKELKPLYDGMPASKQELFRVRGEKAVQRIRDDVAKGKLNRYRTMKVLGDWLSIIPKVDKYWVGQERKNRTDDLFDLQKKEQRKAA